MDDLTIIYYTRNVLSDAFTTEICKRLIEVANGTEIISVSHKPMNLGRNICIGIYPKSNYMLWKQIFLGVLLAKTDYVVMAEDDVVYTREHFEYRPPNLQTFCYNTNRWQLNPDNFFWRYSLSMGMCVAPRAELVTNLALRFAKAPTWQGELKQWAEPGLKEHMDNLPMVKLQKFCTKSPQIMINHRDSVGGLRHRHAHDVVVNELEGVGIASDLWKSLCAHQ